MDAERPQQVTVALGPGPYTEDLVRELGRHDMLHRVIRSWPEFAVDRWSAASGRLERIVSRRLYAVVVRTVWATWRRIPRLGRYRTPQSLLYFLFDHLAARYLGDPDLFVGWSQVSLHSLRVAKRRRIRTALEHPMLHVATWQSTMADEYARYSPSTAEYYSIFPESLVKRMFREYQEAEHIVVPSSVARETFVRANVPPQRLVQVPFGVNTGFFDVTDSRAEDPFRVVFAGRLELLKGLHYLLQAWNSLGLKDAKLTLVGPVLPEIREILASAVLPGTVEVLGQLPRERLKDVLGRSDVVVFPSICDAFGLVILEAMACGRPVIATTRSGGPDVITEGVDGFVVPPRDPKAIAERLEWLYLHREECREMGRRARLKVESAYDLASYGDRLVRAYTQMVASRRSPTATSPTAVEDA